MVTNPSDKAVEAEALLNNVVVSVCQPCLDGVKGECHWPGCIQWGRTDGERLDFEYRYERVAEAERKAVEAFAEELRSKIDEGADENGAYQRLYPEDIDQALAHYGKNE